MIQRLFYTMMLLCVFTIATAAENNWQLSVNGENMDTGEAASIAIQSRDYLYFGLSLNYINSSTAIQYNNRTTIYPLFIFMGLKAPTKIAPFIEGGLDLPEYIIDEALDDEENKIDLTDYYLAGGLNIEFNKKFALSVYARKYVFKYQETGLTTTNKVRLDSVGAALIMRF